MKNYTMEPKTIIILGMHRSATSLVAKGLSQVIEMHPNGHQFPDQPDGNWENLVFVRLNDAILEAAGGSWDNPPSEEAILNIPEKLKDIVKDLVERYNEAHDYWGWKDPRTCLTYPIYKPYLRNPILNIVVRDPKQVAESLNKRNGFSLDKGTELAKIYNERILKIYQGHIK